MPTTSDRNTIREAAERVRRGDTSSGYPENRAELEDLIIERAE